MSALKHEDVLEAANDLGRARSLVALLTWACSHRTPPTKAAWGGLYIVASDAEAEIEAVEKALRNGVRR